MQALARELGPASALESVPEPVLVLGQGWEPVPAAQELALEQPLAEAMAPVALTNRRQRTLRQAARTPHAEELT